MGINNLSSKGVDSYAICFGKSWDRQTDRQTDSYKSATFDAKNYISLIISTDEIHFLGV